MFGFVQLESRSSIIDGDVARVGGGRDTVREKILKRLSRGDSDAQEKRQPCRYDQDTTDSTAEAGKVPDCEFKSLHLSKTPKSHEIFMRAHSL